MKKFFDYLKEPIEYTRSEKWFYHTVILILVLDNMVDVSFSFFGGN